MADAPFDRTNIGLRERPVSGDLNQIQSQIYRAITEFARSLLSGRTSNSLSSIGSASSFLGDGFRVLPVSPAAMQVQVNAGMGFFYDPIDVPANIGATDLEHVDDFGSFKPLPLIGPALFGVPAAPSTPNNRCDILEVKADRRLENAITRRQLDPGTESFLDHTFFKTLAYALDGRTGVVSAPANSTAGMSYKIGVPANLAIGDPGLLPATSPGYVKIAEINVPNGATSITGLNIVDRRRLMGGGGLVRASARFVTSWNGSTTDIVALSIDAPPGVDMIVVGNAFKGGFALYGTAADFVHVVRNCTIDCLSIASGESVTFTPTHQDEPILGVDALFQPQLATAGLSVGIGTNVFVTIGAGGRTIFRDTTGASSVTNTKLDNVSYNISFDIAYHQ